MESESKKCCNTCKFGGIIECETLSKNKQYQSIKSNNLFNYEEIKFKDDFVCGNYKSRYIEYPIEVSNIVRNTNKVGVRDSEIGRFVSIRPCGEEYKGKTFLGLYLGDQPIDILVSHNAESKVLSVNFFTNPAIFVFDLNKIVYGCESWWKLITDENDLKAITDADIENVWYMKALKTLTKEKQEG